MSQRSLPIEDALELSVKISPKIKVKANVRNQDRRILLRFIRSLRGNPLAITLFARHFEQTNTPALNDFVRSSWSFSPQAHSEIRHELKETHFWARTRILSEVKSFDVCSFAAFREYIPKSWLDFVNDPEAFLTSIVDKDSLTQISDNDNEGVTADQGSDNRDGGVYPLLHPLVHHEAEAIMELFKAWGLVFDCDSPKHWAIHPLLPYALELFWETMDPAVFRSVRQLLFVYYDSRSSTWFKALPETAWSTFETAHARVPGEAAAGASLSPITDVAVEAEFRWSQNSTLEATAEEEVAFAADYCEIVRVSRYEFSLKSLPRRTQKEKVKPVSRWGGKHLAFGGLEDESDSHDGAGTEGSASHVYV
jgi:hypothetical protein